MRQMVAVIMIFGAIMVQAEPMPSSSRWYYDMGGSESFGHFSSRKNYGFAVGADAKWNLGNACSFDPSISVGNYVSDFKKSIYGVKSAVLASASSMVRGMALDALQKANPGLYDMVTKSIAQASLQYDLAIKNCNDIQKDIDAGQNPIDGWVTLSNKAAWTAANTAGGKDAVTTQEEIEENSGDQGVTWVDGKTAGGKGQPPINIVKDTVSVGYQYWDDSDMNSRIKKVFPTPEGATQYAHKVIGETTIRTCTNCQRLTTRVALGLKAAHREEAEVLLEKMADIVNTEDTVSVETIASLSAPGMGITINREVIIALRGEDPADRAILSQRLASEIAMHRQVEKMMLLREILKTAKQDPNIAVNEEAVKTIDKKLKLIRDTLDEMLWERKVRQELATPTAATIIERANMRNSDPSAVRPVTLNTQNE